MNTQITLAIPDAAYRKATQIATISQQSVEDVLVEFTRAGAQLALASIDEPDPVVEREKAAYLALHPQLLRDYPNQFVAIQDGQLVDYDLDRANLMQRVGEQYPTQFVWVSQILSQAIRTIRMPSYRLSPLSST